MEVGEGLVLNSILNTRPMENAKGECSPILEPSEKWEMASGKECRISEKREWYTEGGLKRSEDSHNLRTISG